MKKTCKVCGLRKPLRDYYKHVLSRCKECHKRAVTENRRTNPSVREYDRERAKTPERRKHSREITINWRGNFPERYKAQTAVGNALRDGKLKRGPCEKCGATENIHGHHHDYSKPLDVTWLCALCHHRLHADQNRERANA